MLKRWRVSENGFSFFIGLRFSGRSFARLFVFNFSNSLSEGSVLSCIYSCLIKACTELAAGPLKISAMEVTGGHGHSDHWRNDQYQIIKMMKIQPIFTACLYDHHAVATT